MQHKKGSYQDAIACVKILSYLFHLRKKQYICGIILADTHFVSKLVGLLFIHSISIHNIMMKHLKIILGLCLIALFASACSSNKYKELIIGNWAGTEWLLDGKPSESNGKNTAFSFTDKGEYVYENEGTTQKGSYRIEKDKLYTTPLNQQEIMVKIAKLTQDSLVFDMNRGGQSETLTLIRKQLQFIELLPNEYIATMRQYKSALHFQLLLTRIYCYKIRISAMQV